MQQFKDHLTGLRDKPGHDQPLVVVHNWIVSLYIKPSNTGEHCILCAHKDSLGFSSNTVSSVLLVLQLVMYAGSIYYEISNNNL